MGLGVWWPKSVLGRMARPPVPLYRPGDDLNDREECSHCHRSAPSLLRLLHGRGGDTSVIYFRRGREGAGAALCFQVEEAARCMAGGAR
jgi:hypothetical protein